MCRVTYIRMKMDRKKSHLRPSVFYICTILLGIWKQDGKLQKWDGKQDSGDQDGTEKERRYYPSRICGIPFSSRMGLYSSRFRFIQDSPIT